MTAGVMPSQRERNVVRQLVLYTLISLDGVAEEPGNWLFDAGDELFSNLGRIIEAQDDIILGRRTYDYWVDYWPTSDVEPFATFINRTTKHVVTSSPLTTPWVNAARVETPLVGYVRDLKDRDGGDIGIHGSIQVARTLRAAGLIDVMHLVIAPTMAGTGTSLWGELDSVDRLTLEACDTDPYGNVFLTYRRPE